MWHFEPMTDLLSKFPIPTVYFRLMNRFFGQSDGRALEGTGVSQQELSDPSVEISLFQLLRQIDNINSIYGPGWIFLRPDIWDAATYGGIELAVISAPTLGEGIALIPRYVHISTPWLRGRLRSSGDLMVLEWEVLMPLGEDRGRPMMEATFLIFRAIIQKAIGQDANILQFVFAGPPPAYADRIHEVLGASVHFGAARDQIVMPRQWWSARLLTANAPLHLHSVAQLKTTMDQKTVPFQLRARVERILMTMPEGQRLNAEIVARSLGLSRRTMTRHLSRADVRFSDLLDAELRARAVRLRAANLSRDQIAASLGYQDPASFSRAWRRWFSLSHEKFTSTGA